MDIQKRRTVFRIGNIGNGIVTVRNGTIRSRVLERRYEQEKNVFAGPPVSPFLGFYWTGARARARMYEPLTAIGDAKGRNANHRRHL
jgi:hypothetical protein